MSTAVLAMIDQGNALETQGRIAEAMSLYDAAARIDPGCARAHLNRGNILIATAALDGARAAYELAIACDPSYAAAHFNLANLNDRVGDLEGALAGYQTAIGLRPDFADALVSMANTLDSLGRSADAIQCYERALSINPDYAEVHFNLGVLATSQGRYDSAASSLRRALEIKPDLTQARRALGNVYRTLGQLEAAEASLRRALADEPESDEILQDLSMILLSQGKSPEALQLLVHALERPSTWTTKQAFANCAARTRFMLDDRRTRAALTTAITEPWGLPSELCQPALSMVMLDPRIADRVHLANKAWPARLPKSALFGADCLAALAGDALLLALMVAAPVTTMEFERFLTGARHALLETASSSHGHEPLELAALQFYSALARQCFVNEYIFDCDAEEHEAAVFCRERVVALLAARAPVPPVLLLAVAAYFPLHTLRGANRLLDSDEPGPIEEILRQQIREPLKERALRPGICRLTSITAGTSEEVRDQYEQNPYPRWVKLPQGEHPPRFNQEMRRTLPLAPFTPLPDDSAPEALVAGCGTGIHSILVARRYRGIRVLAVDLSLSSLAYAKRKTEELGTTNIEYAQADILRLDNMGRSFDLIESVGVLHHLADPFAGWQTLLSLLRPGGVMALGFYSEIARRHVVKARATIAARGFAGSPDDIRRFRRDLAIEGAKEELRSLSTLSDYYSISECRDLLFHVQEHRLTLGEIESFLDELGLRFLGFKVDPRTLNHYFTRFGDDPSATNLRNWACFEAANPDAFIGMYQFWIQKPEGSRLARPRS